MACYVPSAQYEGVRHILRDAGSETGAGHKPCECLGGAGRTSGAGPSHHGFRGSQPSGPHFITSPKVEGRFSGLFPRGRFKGPAGGHEKARRRDATQRLSPIEAVGRSEPVRPWSTNYATAVTSLWAGSTMLCSRTLTRSSRPFAGRRTRSWDSFLGIPRRGSQFMFSYVACTMTTSRASTGT